MDTGRFWMINKKNNYELIDFKTLENNKDFLIVIGNCNI
jgi:hypothetical protein